MTLHYDVYGRSTGGTKTSHRKRHRQHRVRGRWRDANVSVQSRVHQVSVYSYPFFFKKKKKKRQTRPFRPSIFFLSIPVPVCFPSFFHFIFFKYYLLFYYNRFMYEVRGERKQTMTYIFFPLQQLYDNNNNKKNINIYIKNILYFCSNLNIIIYCLRCKNLDVST